MSRYTLSPPLPGTGGRAANEQRGVSVGGGGEGYAVAMSLLTATISYWNHRSSDVILALGTGAETPDKSPVYSGLSLRSGGCFGDYFLAMLEQRRW